MTSSSAKHSLSDKPVRLSDGGGLYLGDRTERRQALALEMHRFAGKEKRLALGTYPETSLAEVRERHVQARKLLKSGIDPGEQRKVEN